MADADADGVRAMIRDELVILRNTLQREVEQRKQLGDYDANAAGVRLAIEACLKIAQHLLDRMRAP